MDYPVVGGVPWLFAEPGAALGEWRGRLHLLLSTLDREQRQLAESLRSASLTETTRRRVGALAAAKKEHAEKLGALLAPLQMEGLTGAEATYLAMRTRLPPDQGLTTYYGNLHRDWSWGHEENEASLEIVQRAAPASAMGHTLVLGAGAGRLAYDVHLHGAETTTALDFNPLLMLAAHKIFRGETIELYEFPIAPRQLGDEAVPRRLAADAPARAGLLCVLADVHRPPFAPQSFDTVLTPWLVDILPERFPDLCARINLLLAPGGRWINFGSLSFHTPDPVFRYSLEECCEAIGATGFAAPDVAQTTIPYLCSPASRHGRRETVVSWSAVKTAKARRPPRYEALPDWLVRGAQPVPLLDSFRSQATTTRIHAFIMSLIDGKRSLKDMAAILQQQGLMGRDEAESSLRTFLIKMYDDSRRIDTY